MKLNGLSKYTYSDKKVLKGTRCFNGSRVPVVLVFEYIKKGWNLDEIRRSLPSVKKEYIIGLMDSYQKSLTI